MSDKQFNPAAYTLTAAQAVEKWKNRKAYEEANAHLALEFPILGLREYIPPQLPGETSVIAGRSGEGKSTFLKFWHDQNQLNIQHRMRRAVSVYISHEDTSEMSAGQLVERYGSEVSVEDNLSIYIGRSFGMSASDIADLHMTNIAQCLMYAQNKQFAEKMDFSAIFYDYIQTTPPDPFRRQMRTDDSRRLQLADDVRRLTIAATTFACPVVAASQTSLKRLIKPYNDKMFIPGKQDLEEAKEVFQTPDIVYSMWQVAADYPPGTQIETGHWNFKSQSDLFFIWFLKRRYKTPKTAPGIRRVFPIFINQNGTFFTEAALCKISPNTGTASGEANPKSASRDWRNLFQKEKNMTLEEGIAVIIVAFIALILAEL